MRINAIGHARMDADLQAVVRPGLEGLVCPKVDTPEEVRKVDAILTEREPNLEMQKGKVKLLIAIESPKGLLNAPAIAASSPRISGLIFGAEDFGREIGLPTSREGEARDLIYARSAIVIAATARTVRSIDCSPLIGGPVPGFRTTPVLVCYSSKEGGAASGRRITIG